MECPHATSSCVKTCFSFNYESKEGAAGSCRPSLGGCGGLTVGVLHGQSSPSTALGLHGPCATCYLASPQPIISKGSREPFLQMRK